MPDKSVLGIRILFYGYPSTDYLSVSVFNHMMTVVDLKRSANCLSTSSTTKPAFVDHNETKITKMPIIPLLIGMWVITRGGYAMALFNTMIMCYAESIRLFQVKLVMIYNNLHKRQLPHATAWNKPITLRNMSMKIEFPQINDPSAASSVKKKKVWAWFWIQIQPQKLARSGPYLFRNQ